MIFAKASTALACTLLCLASQVSSGETLRGIIGGRNSTTTTTTTTTTTEINSLERELQADGNWDVCANERETCNFAGSKIVRYGTGTSYFYQRFPNGGGFTCSNDVFGGDPQFGIAKSCSVFNEGTSQAVLGNTHSCSGNPSVSCQYSYGLYDFEVPCLPIFFGDTIASGSCEYTTGLWAKCADEGGTCTVPAGETRTVRYGAAGNYIWRDETGVVPCTNQRFGRDPIFGTLKSCLMYTSSTWTSCGGRICDLPSNGFTVRFGGEDHVQGQTSGLITMPHVPVAAANLPDGRILTWSAASKYVNPQGPRQTYTCIFDPVSNTCPIRLITTTGHDMFCPGTAVLPDSRVMITGGTHATPTTIYNPNNDVWSAGPELNVGRGYHSMTMRRDGSVFTMGGSWNAIGTTPGDKFGELWNPQAPNVWELKNGINTIPSINTDDVNPIFRDNHMWLFEAANGRIFQAGPSKQMHWIDVAGSGSITPSIMRADHGDAMCGTATMYDIGKILVVGGATTYNGNVPAKVNAYIIDITGAEARVTRVGDMAFARTYANSVALPTGEVAIVGGQGRPFLFQEPTAVTNIEIWNPRTGSFRLGGQLNIPRVYHSFAILMKDARVLIGGGGLCGTVPACGAGSTNHDDVEIYTPPYLLNANGGRRGNRPVVVSAPSSVRPGQVIQTQLNANTGGHSFVLMRLSAVTHSTNNDARRIPLPVVQTSGSTFSLQIPDAGTLPGVYWLFALNAEGTPSVGFDVMVDT